MPSARYWRLSRIETPDYGDLVLSEIALFDGASRVDGSATLTSTFAPAAGALADLKDADFGTSVTWASADLFFPGFSLSWDFGSAQNITKIGVAGPAQVTFAHKFALDYSSDGIVWTTYSLPTPSTTWPGAASFYELDSEFDLSFVNVSLLLRGDGPNNSTTIIDSSGVAPKVMTARGNAKISTTTSKFGGSSLFMNGSGDVFTTPDSDGWNFGSGNFTVECWFNLLAIPANNTGQVIVSSWDGTNPSFSWFLALVNLSGVYSINFAHSVNGSTQINNVKTAGFTANAWHHVAVSRVGNTLRSFFNGVQVGSPTDFTGVTLFNANSMLTVGGVVANSSGPTFTSNYAGYIDDLRITNGVGRYAADFTPPDKPFFGPSAIFDATPLRTKQAGEAIIISEYPVGTTEVADVVVPQFAFDQEDGGNFEIVGTVKEVALPVNTPLARRVRLYEERSGRFIKGTFSDAAGNYAFTELRGDRPYTVVAFDHTDTYRAVVADKLIAEPMS